MTASRVAQQSPSSFDNSQHQKSAYILVETVYGGAREKIRVIGAFKVGVESTRKRFDHSSKRLEIFTSIPDFLTFGTNFVPIIVG